MPTVLFLRTVIKAIPTAKNAIASPIFFVHIILLLDIPVFSFGFPNREKFWPTALVVSSNLSPTIFLRFVNNIYFF
jgi:hypothetical protein